MLWDFLFSYILLKERNDSRIPQASFLILVSNKNNSKAIPKSSSIKLIWACGFVTSSLHFKHMVMANYNASNNNQWLLDGLKTHPLTTRERQSTFI
jgi:hypothetical protein